MLQRAKSRRAEQLEVSDEEDRAGQLAEAEDLWKDFKKKVRKEAQKDDHGFLNLELYLKEEVFGKHGSGSSKNRVLETSGLVAAVKAILDREVGEEVCEIVLLNLGQKHRITQAQLISQLQMTAPELQNLARSFRKKLKKELPNDKSAEAYFNEKMQGTGMNAGRLTAARLQNRLVRVHKKDPTTEEETGRLLELLDVDGDGRCSAGDFLAFLGAAGAELTAKEGDLDERAGKVIVDLQVSTSKADEAWLDQHCYERLEMNLNRGTGARGVYLWCCRRENAAVARLRAVVDVVVDGSRVNSALVVNGYTCVAKSLNAGTIGKAQYLWVRRARTEEEEARDGIYAVAFTTGREKDRTSAIHEAPDRGYYLVAGNLNRRNFGEGVFLWVRPLQTRPFGADRDAAEALKKAARLTDQAKRLEVEATARRLVRYHVHPAAVARAKGGAAAAAPGAAGAEPLELAALFNKHSGGKGTMKLGAFQSLLKEVGLNLSKADMKSLMNRFAVTKGSGAVSREEFLSFLALTEDELDDVADELQRKVGGRLSAAVNGNPREWVRDLKLEFRRLDRDGDGLLSDAELQALVCGAGVAWLTGLEVARLRRRFDRDGDGRLDLRNFLEFMVAPDAGGGGRARRQAVRVSEALQVLRQTALDQQRAPPLRHTPGAGGAGAGGVDSAAAWEGLRRQAKARRGAWPGYLTVEDVGPAVERLGLRLSQQENFQLVMRLAPGGRGRITEEAWHRFVAGPQPRAVGLLLAEVEQLWLPELVDTYRSLDRARRRREAIDDDDVGHVEHDFIGERELREEEKWGALLQAVVASCKPDDQGMTPAADLRGGLAAWARYDAERGEWVDREKEEAAAAEGKPAGGGAAGEQGWPTASEWVALAQYLGADDARGLMVDVRRFVEGLARFLCEDGAEAGEGGGGGGGGGGGVGDVGQYLQDREKENLDAFCRDLQQRIVEEAESRGDGERHWSIPFEMFDQDRSGALDLEELRALLSRLEGFDLLDEDYVQELLLRFDPARRNRITARELRQFAEAEEWPPLSWTREGKEHYRRLAKERKEALLQEEEAEAAGAGEPAGAGGAPLPGGEDTVTGDPAADRLVAALLNAVRPSLHHDPEAALADLGEAFGVLDPGGAGALAPDRVLRALQRVHVHPRLSRTRFVRGLRFFHDAEGHVVYGTLVKAVSKAWGIEKGKADCGLTGHAKLDAKILRLQRDFRDLSIAKEVDPETGKPQYSYHLKKVFRALDRHRSGRVSPHEFKEALRRMRVGRDLGPKDVARIFYVFNREDHARLRYKDFLHFMLHGVLHRRAGGKGLGQEGEGSSSESSSDGDGGLLGDSDDDDGGGSGSLDGSMGSGGSFFSAGAASADGDGPGSPDLKGTTAGGKAEKLLARLRGKLDELEPAAARRRRFREALLQADPRRTGRVSDRRFRAWLERTGLRRRMKEWELSDLLQLLDPRDTGLVAYKLFVRRVVDPEEEGAGGGGGAAGVGAQGSLTSLQVSELIHRVQGAVLESAKAGKAYHMVFGLSDPGRTGLVAKADFLHALALLGAALDDAEARVLLARGTPRTDGQVDYEEFWRLLLATRTASGAMMDATGFLGAPHVVAGGGLGATGMGMGVTGYPPGMGTPGAGLGAGLTGMSPINAMAPGMNHTTMGMAGTMMGYPPMTPGMNLGLNPQQLEVVCANVRQAVMVRQQTQGLQFSLVRSFEAFDPNLRGFVSVAEFAVVLRELGLLLSPPELHVLAAKFSKHGPGTVDYLGFCEMVIPGGGGGGGVGGVGGGSVESALAQVAAKLTEAARRGVTAREVFGAYDPHRTGLVTAYDFRVVCRELHLYFTDATLEALCRAFRAAGRPGHVSYEEFLARAREKVLPEEVADLPLKPPRPGAGAAAAAAAGAGAGAHRRKGSEHSQEEDEALDAGNVEMWYTKHATPHQKQQFEQVYESLREFRHQQEEEEWPADERNVVLPRLQTGRPRRDSREGFLPLRDAASPIASPRASPRGRRGHPRRSPPRGRSRHTSGQDDGMVSPVASAGASVWGARRSQDQRGSVPRWSAKEKYWMCAVCFYSENPAGAGECEICQSANPDSRGSAVVQQCGNCTFQNSADSLKCEMCGHALHYNSSTAARREKHEHIQGKRLLAGRGGGGRRGSNAYYDDLPSSDRFGDDDW